MRDLKVFIWLLWLVVPFSSLGCATRGQLNSLRDEQQSLAEDLSRANVLFTQAIARIETRMQEFQNRLEGISEQLSGVQSDQASLVTGLRELREASALVDQNTKEVRESIVRLDQKIDGSGLDIERLGKVQKRLDSGVRDLTNELRAAKNQVDALTTGLDKLGGRIEQVERDTAASNRKQNQEMRQAAGGYPFKVAIKSASGFAKVGEEIEAEVFLVNLDGVPVNAGEDVSVFIEAASESGEISRLDQAVIKKGTKSQTIKFRLDRSGPVQIRVRTESLRGDQMLIQVGAGRLSRRNQDVEGISLVRVGYLEDGTTIEDGRCLRKGDKEDVKVILCVGGTGEFTVGEQVKLEALLIGPNSATRDIEIRVRSYGGELTPRTLTIKGGTWREEVKISSLRAGNVVVEYFGVDPPHVSVELRGTYVRDLSFVVPFAPQRFLEASVVSSIAIIETAAVGAKSVDVYGTDQGLESGTVVFFDITQGPGLFEESRSKKHRVKITDDESEARATYSPTDVGTSKVKVSARGFLSHRKNIAPIEVNFPYLMGGVVLSFGALAGLIASWYGGSSRLRGVVTGALIGLVIYILVVGGVWVGWVSHSARLTNVGVAGAVSFIFGLGGPVLLDWWSRRNGGHSMKATSVFGFILLLFLIGLVIWNPQDLASTQQRVVRILASVFVGIISAFFAGSLKLGGKIPGLNDMTIAGVGGFAAFALVFLLW